MKIHILQHVPFEGPGYIADWAADRGHITSFTRFYEPDHQLPALTDVDALVILGGPMDVFAEHEYDWLHTEKIFIEDCIQTGKKVLGICLGAQLVAVCLGAMVSTAAQKEIGWYPVVSTKDSERSPWLNELFKSQPVVLHWHGDKFQIPYGGIDLLYAPGNSNQAFLFNEHVLGLQFHLELTAGGLDNILSHCGRELQPAPFIQSEEQIRDGYGNIPGNQQILGQLLVYFFENSPAAG